MREGNPPTGARRTPALPYPPFVFPQFSDRRFQTAKPFRIPDRQPTDAPNQSDQTRPNRLHCLYSSQTNIITHAVDLLPLFTQSRPEHHRCTDSPTFSHPMPISDQNTIQNVTYKRRSDNDVIDCTTELRIIEPCQRDAGNLP